MNTTEVERRIRIRATNEPAYTRQSFPVTGMSCAACAVSVESMLKSVEGVKSAGVNFANQSAWVEFDTSRVSPSDLKNTIRSIGYDLIIDAEDPQQVQHELQVQKFESLKKRTIWASVISAPIVVIGMFFMDMPYANWIMMLLATPVVFWFGRGFFINAWRQASFGKANMDTLVALSTGIAFFFSLFNTIFPDFWHNRGVHAHVYFEAAAVVV
ncbi:MAG TPA: cation transporter, partial [Chitinophagaceae bacterium]